MLTLSHNLVYSNSSEFLNSVRANDHDEEVAIVAITSPTVVSISIFNAESEGANLDQFGWLLAAVGALAVVCVD